MNFSRLSRNLSRRKILFSVLFSHPNTTHHFASTHARSPTTAAASAWLYRPSPVVSRAHIFVWLEQDEINLRREQAREHHRRAYVEAHAQTGRLNLVIVAGAEVNCDGREEHYARRVHCKPNIFGFVEVLRNFSRFESVDCAERN